MEIEGATEIFGFLKKTIYYSFRSKVGFLIDIEHSTDSHVSMPTSAFNYLGKPAIGSFIVFVLPSHSRFTTTFYDGVLGESISCKWLATLFTLFVQKGELHTIYSTRSVHDVLYR